jgi:hypothetical protein
MNDCCENCRFWIRFTIQPKTKDGSAIGECVRHAPRVFQGADGRLHTKWPSPSAGKWCGDHKAADLSGVPPENSPSTSTRETRVLPGTGGVP